MALTLLVPGVLRQVWQESATLNGGNSRTIPTGIRVRTAGLPCISAVLYVTPVVGAPQISATVASVGGFAVVSVNNTAPAGNTATYQLDIMRVQSTQQARGGVGGVVQVALGAAAGFASGGFTLPTTDVNIGHYPVVASDVVLEVRRTAAGPCGVDLPAVATLPGRILVIKDSGYNANNNNIAAVPLGADKVNNVAGAYIINLPGVALWLQANATTGDWEIL